MRSKTETVKVGRPYNFAIKTEIYAYAFDGHHGSGSNIVATIETTKKHRTKDVIIVLSTRRQQFSQADPLCSKLENECTSQHSTFIIIIYSSLQSLQNSSFSISSRSLSVCRTVFIATWKNRASIAIVPTVHTK